VAQAMGTPMVLLVTVPSGILICSSAMGLGAALQLGLKVRVYEWIAKRKWNPAIEQQPRARR
jgi:hypothetical protein